MEEIVSQPKYKKAFKCNRCPQSGDENGCPMWWTTVQTEEKTGEQRVYKGCGFVLLPNYMEAMWSSMRSSAAAVEGNRNAIAKGFESVVQPMIKLVALAQRKQEQEDLQNLLQIQEGLENDNGIKSTSTDPTS